MTTSNLVGLDSMSSQELLTPLAESALLAEATERSGAYRRLKTWLYLSEEEASAAADQFRRAVSTLSPAEQERIVQAESDALRHGFSFIDFQKLKGYALRALESPYKAAGIDDDSSTASSIMPFLLSQQF